MSSEHFQNSQPRFVNLDPKSWHTSTDTSRINPPPVDATGLGFSNPHSPAFMPASENSHFISPGLRSPRSRASVPRVARPFIDRFDGLNGPLPPELRVKENITHKNEPRLQRPPSCKFENSKSPSEPWHTCSYCSGRDGVCLCWRRRCEELGCADSRHFSLDEVEKRVAVTPLASPTLSERLFPQGFSGSNAFDQILMSEMAEHHPANHLYDDPIFCENFRRCRLASPQTPEDENAMEVGDSRNMATEELIDTPPRSIMNERATTPRARIDLKCPECIDHASHVEAPFEAQIAGSPTQMAPDFRPAADFFALPAPQTVFLSGSTIPGPQARSSGSGFTQTLVLPPLQRPPLSGHHSGFGPFASLKFGLPLSSRWSNPSIMPEYGFIRSDPVLYKSGNLGYHEKPYTEPSLSISFHGMPSLPTCDECLLHRISNPGHYRHSNYISPAMEHSQRQLGCQFI